jgi:hypothetical protein
MTDKRLVEIIITTPRQIIEKERARLIALRDSKDQWWTISNRSDIVLADFSTNVFPNVVLAQYNDRKSDITYVGGLDKGYCQICGENFGLDEEFVSMSFSFCDEYDCGMSIHKICPKLQEVIK